MTGAWRALLLGFLMSMAGTASAMQIVATPVADPARVATPAWAAQLPAFEPRFGQPIDLQVEPFTTVDDVLQLLQDKTGLFPSDAEVRYAGKLLVRDGTLSDYNIADGAMVDILVATGSAVPEPAAWMLMITGFGAIGLSLRRAGPIAHPAG